jgi:hypothetical protein
MAERGILGSANELLGSGADAAKNFSGAISGAGSALESLNDSVLKSGKGISALENSLKQTGASVQSFSKALANVKELTPISDLSGLFKDIGMFGEKLISLTGGITSVVTESIRVTDSLTSVNRNLVAENFKLFAQFGEGTNTVQEFSNSMLANAERMASSEMGYQNFATETRKVVEALMQQKISFEQLTDPIRTNIGDFDLYSAAILQAQALGLDLSTYSKLISDAMISQGKSANEAAQLLALYGEIASDTGLTVNTVSTSLNSMANGFRKMGLDANFGESFLRGFVSTLKETGIGIENASDLAQTFGNRLASLATNYSSSFITAMRGGLDMGSGGALGAGIQLQARLMSKEEDQAQLGKDIAEAVRDTIASFTGGEIVTVTEAAESRDPRLEQIYYTQTQMLSSLYGISDATDSARVLELLEQMSEAQATGDTELMKSVGDNLTEALNMREQTLSNEEKLNSLATAQLAELSLQTQLITGMLSLLAKETSGEVIKNAIITGNEGLQSFLEGYNERFEEARTKLETGEAKTVLGAFGMGAEQADILKILKERKEESTGEKDNDRLTREVLTETLRTLNNTLQSLLNSGTPLAGTVR